MSECPMFYAEMQTEHFTFRAIASYRPEALSAILRGWKEHVRKELTINNLLAFATVDELQEWYGINVYEIPINECLRDDTNLNIR